MLKKVRLELARTPKHPSGSHEDGYVLIAPLTARGKLDFTDLDRHQPECRVTRFVGNAAHRHGLLHYAEAENSKAAKWFVTFDDDTRATGFRFDTEFFIPGEYVSLADAENEVLPYKVVSVTPADIPTIHKTHL